MLKFNVYIVLIFIFVVNTSTMKKHFRLVNSKQVNEAEPVEGRCGFNLFLL